MTQATGHPPAETAPRGVPDPTPDARAVIEARRPLYDTMLAFVRSKCLYTACRLGVFDMLETDGPLPVAELASRTGTNADRLHVVLRALAHDGVVEEREGKVFAPTAQTAELATAGEPSLAHLVMHLLEPAQWTMWNSLEESLRRDEVAFEIANGDGVYEYCRAHPWSQDVFVKAMSFFTRHSLDALLDAYDFSRFGTVMDVGGGQGGLIGGIVARHGVKGMLFDVPKVIETAGDYLRSLGVEDGAVELHAGDVFERVPEGADAIVMKYFLSAWNDADAVTILSNCREALPAGGRLILLQAFVPEHDEEKRSPDGLMPGLFAVQINAAVPGGRWRTRSEFRALFEANGFAHVRTVDTNTNLSAMEFEPA